MKTLTETTYIKDFLYILLLTVIVIMLLKLETI